MPIPTWDETEPLFEETTPIDEFGSPSISGMPTLNPNQESTFLQDFVGSSALPIMGGILGGTVGATTTPITGFGGAVAGAALGGAAGESYRQLAARKMGLPVPGTSMGAAKEIGVEGLTQGAGEAIGGGIVGPLLGKVGKLLKKPAGQLFQIITKMKPEDASTLFKNPKALLPGEWTKAKKEWKEAAESIGLQTDEVSPEMIKILKGDAKQMVFETYEKIVSGEAVSAKDAQLAKQALDIAVMPVAKTVRKNPLVKTLGDIRKTFVDRIGEESERMGAANKAYGIAATGNRFRSFFPRNTTGDPAYFRSLSLPILGSLGSDSRGEGALKGAALSALLSPVSIGTGIAGAGMLRPALPVMRRGISASLAELFDDEFEGK